MPDDPDGNAKLVFSILDCLPKANRVMRLSILFDEKIEVLEALSEEFLLTLPKFSFCGSPFLSYKNWL